MSSDVFSVDWIPVERKDELSDFRRRIFREHYGERVDTDRLGWNHNDDVFPSLGAFSPTGELVSCLRLSPVPTPEEFERILLFPYSANRLPLPLLVVGRSATARSYARRGLHSCLRMLAIRIALHRKLNAVVWSAAKDDHRQSQFQAMGCLRIPYTENWAGFLPSVEPPMLYVLQGAPKMVLGAGWLERRINQQGTLFDIRVHIEQRTDRI